MSFSIECEKIKTDGARCKKISHRYDTASLTSLKFVAVQIQMSFFRLCLAVPESCNSLFIHTHDLYAVCRKMKRFADGNSKWLSVPFF